MSAGVELACKSFYGLSADSTLPALPRASVVVRPKVGDIPSMDFARAADLVARGLRPINLRTFDNFAIAFQALRAGQVFINNYGAGGGVELPFGGVGASGHGREKGFEALYGFTALKTVAIRHD